MTNHNDKLYLQIMKSIKARKEMAKYASSEDQVREDEFAIRELLAQAKTLTGRL